MTDQGDVLFIPDLMRLLRVSRRTLMRRLRAGGAGLPPRMPSPDNRHRWYRPTVEKWMGGDIVGARRTFFRRAI